MDRNEKLLLLDVILQDIRGNWGWDLDSRVDAAMELAVELELPQFVESIGYFQTMISEGYADGRYFRDISYTRGGYGGMSVMHGLDYTIADKSLEFQREASAVLTYPEHRFDDWEKWEQEDGA